MAKNGHANMLACAVIKGLSTLALLQWFVTAVLVDAKNVCTCINEL